MSGYSTRGLAVAVGCMAALLASGIASGQELEPRRAPPPTFMTPADDGNGLRPPFVPQGVPMPQVIWQKGDAGQQEPLIPSEYWLGIQCGDVSPALQTQLGLKDEHGVLVEAIVDGSPAAEAGIEKYDVLVRAGERKLAKVQDLIDAVDAAKDGKLALEVIRGGQRQTVEATPEKRPPSGLAGEPSAVPAEEWNDFFNYMKKWEPGMDGRRSMKLRFWHPGTILPGRDKADKLPDNVHVHIHKHGDQPSKIDVTRGDESWSLDENELDKLPDDLRPHVERLLGKSPGMLGGVPMPEGILPGAADGMPNVFKKRFEALDKRFDHLQESLENLLPDRQGEKAEDQAVPELEKTTPEESEGASFRSRGSDGKSTGEGNVS